MAIFRHFLLSSTANSLLASSFDKDTKRQSSLSAPILSHSKEPDATWAGASYVSNFRNDGYYDQRWADKWDKWGKRSNWDERYPERQHASCDGSAAMVKGKGAKGGKGGKGGKADHGKGYFGKGKDGKGEKGKGKVTQKAVKGGKGARLPLTDLVPEPDPEQRLLMVRVSAETETSQVCDVCSHIPLQREMLNQSPKKRLHMLFTCC